MADGRGAENNQRGNRWRQRTTQDTPPSTISEWPCTYVAASEASQSTAARLSCHFSTLNKRLSEPDRYTCPPQVTQDGGFAAYESVTGDALFYSKQSARGLWMQPTDGGPETQVLDDLALPDWGNWAVTEGGLYFVRRSDAGTTIAFHDLATGTNRSVASIPNIASPSLEVSPDGRRLLYARIEQSNSDLIATTLRWAMHLR